MTRYIPNFKAPNKYGAKKTEVDGITFNSKAEAARYLKLKQMQQAGSGSGISTGTIHKLRKIAVKEGVLE